jgi:glycosyltransferase involved in cell wall biosynthesis
LESVARQTLQSFECLVVDDGSGPEAAETVRGIVQSLGQRFRYLAAGEHGGGGQGPGHARNIGIRAAAGSYVAFCDDDDQWARDDHLACAVESLNAEAADFFFANMRTVSHGIVKNPDFYGRLPLPPGASPANLPRDVYRLSVADIGRLLRHRTLHCNSIVVHRRLLEKTGLYWDKIRFAEDHEFCFKAVDAATGILYRSTIVADLDVSPHPSLARTHDVEDRLVLGIAACLRAGVSVRNRQLRKVLRANQAWRFLELSELALDRGERRIARDFALRGLATSLSYLGLKAVLKSL